MSVMLPKIKNENLIDEKVKPTPKSGFTTFTLIRNLERAGFIVAPLMSNSQNWDPIHFRKIHTGFKNLIETSPLLKGSLVWLNYDGITIDIFQASSGTVNSLAQAVQKDF